MKYTVHVYASFRIPIEIDAPSVMDAVAKASACFHDEPLAYVKRQGHYAEEITSFMVDEEGDPEFTRTVNLNANREPRQ